MQFLSSIRAANANSSRRSFAARTSNRARGDVRGCLYDPLGDNGSAALFRRVEDVVLIIDGRTAWGGKAPVLPVQALQLAEQFLKDLMPGDQFKSLMLMSNLKSFFRRRRDYRVRGLNDLPVPRDRRTCPLRSPSCSIAVGRQTCNARLSDL